MELLVDQCGVVARGQLLASGVTSGQIDVGVGNRWDVVHRGVYRVPHRSLAAADPSLVAAWAALLYAGPGAVLSHGTAL